MPTASSTDLRPDNPTPILARIDDVTLVGTDTTTGARVEMTLVKALSLGVTGIDISHLAVHRVTPRDPFHPDRPRLAGGDHTRV